MVCSGATVCRAPLAKAKIAPPMHTMAAMSNKLGSRRTEAKAGKVDPDMMWPLLRRSGAL